MNAADVGNGSADPPASDPTNLGKSSSLGTVDIHRPVYNQVDFDRDFGYEPSRESLRQKAIKSIKHQCSGAQLKASLLSFFPILTWIREYNWRIDPVRDLLGGLTVGVMSIPQGMSYAGLIRIPFVYGLYTNIVPTMIYPFVGTSKHGAVGTVTMVSLMLGTLRLKYIPDRDNLLTAACDVYLANTSWNRSQGFDNVDSSIFNHPDCFSATQMVISMAMLGGILFALMGICRLGFIAAYLSDCVVDGFTSGAAVVVVTAQLDYLLGVHLKPYSGPGKVFVTYVELFQNLHTVNIATLVITIICVVCLVIVKELMNPFVQRRLRVPIPGELLAVIIATIVSYYCRFQKTYNVAVVGTIPSGFPIPSLPRFDIMRELFLDTLVVTIVNYSLSMSLAKLMAKKNNYKIDAYQEFYAFSIINIIGSIFQSFQSGVSVARTIVYESTGAKSQFAGLIGTACVIICVVWLAPFLYALPQCILGSIILVACIELLKNLRQLRMLWRVSKYDFFIFMVTFISVIIFDVTYGLAISVVFAFLTVVLRTQCPQLLSLARSGETDVFEETRRYRKAEQVPGVNVFQYQAPLYYANVENFKAKLYEVCKISQTATRRQTGWSAKVTGLDSSLRPQAVAAESARPSHVIINCSSFTYVDIMGINALKEVYQVLKNAGIIVFYAACNASVRHTLESAQFYDIVPKAHLFVTVNDAVLACGPKGMNPRHFSPSRARGVLDREIRKTSKMEAGPYEEHKV